MEIIPLTAVHHLLPFDCGEEEIDRHLKGSAWDQHKENIGTTYVAVDPAEPAVVHGFYSLRAGELSTSSKPPGLKKLKSQGMPIVMVTHFGVHLTSQGRGLGEMMLFDVYRRAQIVSRHIGCHAVCLQALNADVVRFYQKYDMRSHGLDNKNLWIPTSTIEAFGLL